MNQSSGTDNSVIVTAILAVLLVVSVNCVILLTTFVFKLKMDLKQMTIKIGKLIDTYNSTS